MERVNISVGLNEHLFRLLKLKVDKMDSQDRICSLSIDEMSIKCNLFYDFGRDEIIGFENDGVNSSTEPAYALVIMARGLKNNWKQPIEYAFSSRGFSGKQMKTILEQAIVKLAEIGLKPIALISDMGYNNIEMSDLLGVTHEETQFSLGGQDLYYYFDPPHLIKAVRTY